MKRRRSALRRRAFGSGPGARGVLALASLLAGWAACDYERSPRERPRDAVTAGAADSLRLELLAPAEVRASDPVPITLRLTNVSDRPADAHFLGRTIAFDLVVARADGAVVWRRLAGAAIPSILQIRTLAPGESLELGDVWDQRTDAGARAGPGEYTVQGILPSDAPEPLRTPVVPLRIAGGS